MTQTELDRRLRDWLAEREPGHVPPSLRANAARVPYETPLPMAARLRDVLVRSTGGAPAGSSRAVLILLLVGALVAATIASLILTGAVRRGPEPALQRWGAFTVDRPAPTAEMVALPGAAQLGDDESVEFEDLVGSVVTILVPGSAGNASADELTTFAAARARTGERVLFFVGARSPLVLDGLADAGGAVALGIGAIDLSSGGAGTADFPDGRDALVVVDRGGTVAAVFVGTMPGRDELVALLNRLEVGR